MMEIIIMWAKIIGIIIAWELWKFIGWELVNWWVAKQTKQHERNNK